MTKKIVEQALALYRAGDSGSAERLLAQVGVQFVRKRLSHLIQIGSIPVTDAVALWARSFPSQQPLNYGSSVSVEEQDSLDTPYQEEGVGVPRRHVSLTQPRKILLTKADEFLQWISHHSTTPVRIGDFEVLQPWGLVAIAAMARTDDKPAFPVEMSGSTASSRFGHALGLFDVIAGREPHGRAEQGRTVKLHRILQFQSIEPVASEISRLIVSEAEKDRLARESYFDHEETRRTIYYVLVELMRNVVQHSRDPKGGVIVAQSMTRGREYDDSPAIQIAVADTGIGIYEALRSMHTEITSPAMALERSLWPYFSGTFDATKRGSAQNAGLGLFFVSEMAKLSGGRLLLASKGGALFLQGDSTGSLNKCDLLSCEYPGTLVVFEIPKRGVADYHGLIKTITMRAEERAAKNVHVRAHWIRYDQAPVNAYEIVVALSSENTAVAESVAKGQLTPHLVSKTPIVLNFANLEICTQSFIHALLFDPLRVSWALRVPIYVRNASDSIRDGIRLLESYALAEIESENNES